MLATSCLVTINYQYDTSVVRHFYFSQQGMPVYTMILSMFLL